jgi:hypothetical protein
MVIFVKNFVPQLTEKRGEVRAASAIYTSACVSVQTRVLFMQLG